MYKRKIIFLVSSILVVFVLITATFLKQDNEVILSERGSNIINSNAITMMYETKQIVGSIKLLVKVLGHRKVILLMKRYQVVKMVVHLLRMMKA